MLYELERKKMVQVVKNMYAHELTNAAGGNLSQRVGEDMYIMTPTLASQNQLWDISPHEILVVDKNLNIVEGQGKVTREINMHMEMYKADPRMRAIIHAHPKELMTFAILGSHMPLLCENLRALGDYFHCLDYAPSTTQELADKVADFIRESKQDKLPFGALLRVHGVILGGKDLFEVNAMLEKLEINAGAIVKSKILEAAGYHYKKIEGDYQFTEEF